MAADRAQHVDEVIEPALAAGRDVVYRSVQRLDARVPGLRRRPRPRRRARACSMSRPAASRPTSRSCSTARVEWPSRRRRTGPADDRFEAADAGFPTGCARASSSSPPTSPVARGRRDARRSTTSTRAVDAAIAERARVSDDDPRHAVRRRRRPGPRRRARCAPPSRAPSTPTCSSVRPARPRRPRPRRLRRGPRLPERRLRAVRQLPSRAARVHPDVSSVAPHRRGDHRRRDPRGHERGRFAAPSRACARSSSSTTCTSRCAARRRS